MLISITLKINFPLLRCGILQSYHFFLLLKGLEILWWRRQFTGNKFSSADSNPGPHQDLTATLKRVAWQTTRPFSQRHLHAVQVAGWLNVVLEQLNKWGPGQKNDAGKCISADILRMGFRATKERSRIASSRVIHHRSWKGKGVSEDSLQVTSN